MIENNDVPSNLENVVLCADCEEVLKQLPDNCIDIVVTSPPYNFSRKYDVHNDNVDWEGYFNKLYKTLKECIRVIKFGGRIAIVIEPCFSEYVPTHHIISNFMTEHGMLWRNEIEWEKNHYNCKITAWGSWKSPSNPYLKYTWEFVEVFSKGSIRHNGKSENADINEYEFKKWTKARWIIAPEQRMKEFDHPATFPEKLVTRILKLFSFEGDVVLDPFNGAGTTTKVAKELNRRYIGIDISEEYTRKAKERTELAMKKSRASRQVKMF